MNFIKLHRKDGTPIFINFSLVKCFGRSPLGGTFIQLATLDPEDDCELVAEPLQSVWDKLCLLNSTSSEDASSVVRNAPALKRSTDLSEPR